MNDDVLTESPEHARSADLLPQYVNGTLNISDRARVQAHLAHCDACRLEEVVWRALAATTKAHLAPQTIDPPSPALFDAILTQIDSPAAAGTAASMTSTIRMHARRLWQVLQVQAALLPKGIWVPSAFVLTLAFLVGSVWHGISFLPTLLGLVVPLVTAVGLALSYGP